MEIKKKSVRFNSDEKKILVIDDETAIVKLIKFHLEKKKYKVFTAHDGQRGLEMAFEHKPDLIILDINMPKKGGLEFYNDITLSGGKKMFPVVVLTGRLEFENFFKEIDADGFVPKPIDFVNLIETVEDIFLKSEKEGPERTVKNVLIVEDDDRILDQMVAAFVRDGLAVHCIKTIGDLPGQMPRKPLDLVVAKFRLCELISDFKKIPGLMKDDTLTLLYTAAGISPDNAVMEKLFASGIQKASLVWTDDAADLLKRSKEALKAQSPASELNKPETASPV